MQQYIVSPLNYIGGKKKILNQIIPLFPDNINRFVDLFTGGANVGLNVNAKQIFLNDNLVYLIELYQNFKNIHLDRIKQHIYDRITKYKLSLTNEDGYKLLRELYNKNKNPLDLFVLVCFSFNHQIRFNNSHDFNNPFGKERSCYNKSIENNLIKFVERLQNSNIVLSSKNFNEFNFEILEKGDFVYCDPPYLITDGTYNDGKRGFTGWNIKEEITLLNILDELNKNGINFALSNVLEHKGKRNTILEDWLNDNKYITTNINMNYANSNYQTKNRSKNATQEIVITNYMPEAQLFNRNNITLVNFEKNIAIEEEKQYAIYR